MSTYCEYDKQAEYYDKTRKPVATDLVLQVLQQKLGKPLSEIHALDAGCGSGQYALAFLQGGLGRLTLLDASKGMLASTTDKVKEFKSQGRVDAIIQHKLPTLPFPDSTFDAVFFNQVLHHLNSCANGESDHCPNIQRAIQEAWRVLRKGGVLVIDSCAKQQLIDGCWYYRLLPENSKKMISQYPTIFSLRHMISTAGFSNIRCMALLNELCFHEKHYNDVMGALRPEWRCCDSYFSSLTQSEVEQMCQKLTEMEKGGKLASFWEEAENARLNAGQVSKIFAVKV